MIDSRIESLEKDYSRVSETYGVTFESSTTALVKAFVVANEDEDLGAQTIIQALISGSAVSRFVHASSSQPLGSRTIELVDETQVHGLMQALVFTLEQITVSGYLRMIKGSHVHHDETIEDLMAAASILTSAISAYRQIHDTLPDIDDRPPAPDGVDLGSKRIVTMSTDDAETFNA